MMKSYIAAQAWLASRSSRKGQSLAEYGLILALVAVFCIGALQVLGTNIQGMLTQLASSIQSASSG